MSDAASLYEGLVVHQRLAPRRHGFRYRVFAMLGWTLLLGLPQMARVSPAGTTRSVAIDLPRRPALLYGLAMALIAFLASGLSAHLTGLLAGHGLPIALAALWGIGQVAARLVESLQTRPIPALRLNLWVGVALPACFTLGLAGLGSAPLAGLFVLAYGALNGLATLLRASLPLELFANDAYASALGRLLAPAFVLAAVAPWAYALLRTRAGDLAMLWLSLAIALGVMLTALAAAGADVLAGGKRDGAFFTPTVLGGVTTTMPAFREEIFGPVAPVTVVADEDEAVAVANDSEYGLVAAIQTGSVTRGRRLAERLRTGMIHINDQTLNNDAFAPFGGVGASGNGATFGTQSSWEEFTAWQWVTSREQAQPFPF